MRAQSMRFTGMFFSLIIILLIAGAAAAQGGEDPTPTPFWEDNDDPALNGQMDYVEAATAILRDLEPMSSVTRAFLSREELLDYLILMLDEDYPPDVARDDVIFYNAFDFMPLDTNLRQLQLNLLAEQIGGFYDPEIEAMFVISASDDMSLTTKVLYAHEFTHALQDQYFDLESVDMEALQFTAPDQLFAYQSLVEGDAMLMTEGYQSWLMQQNPGAAIMMLSEALSVPTEALNAVPDITSAELLFPYTTGRNFAYTIFAEGGSWNAINTAYQNPPISTEQIIHPEKYGTNEQPAAVELADISAVLGEEWREVWHRTLGEFHMREHLRQAIPADTADEAAAGWGGDSYRVYHNDATAETVLIWKTVWDTPQDAAEFTAAYQDYTAAQPGSETTIESLPCWQSEVKTVCVLSGEDDTLILQAPNQATILTLLATIKPVQ